MSIIAPNPANQDLNQFISGGQIVVPVSGMLPVGIIGSVGSTTFVDVNSSTGADNISTGDDTLATRAFNLGYNLDNDQWTRLYSISYNSGDHVRASLPTSGFALFGMSNIVGTLGDVAEVWSANDDNMFDTDNVLQVGARMYGFLEKGTSGVWPRLRAVAFDQDMSGVGMPTSGFVLATASLIVDQGGRIANVSTPGNDSKPTTEAALDVNSLLHGYYRASGAWGRISTAFSSGDGNGDIYYSGHALVVSMGDAGYLAHVTPTLTHGETAEHSLFTAAFVMGNDSDTSDWYKISAKSNTDGSAGMALEVADTPIASNVDTSRQTVTNDSGGTVLSTFGVISKLFIKNESGNNTMNVGGNNAGDFPHATQGYPLYAGESMEISIVNADMVSVWAATSGQRIRVFGTN